MEKIIIDLVFANNNCYEEGAQDLTNSDLSELKQAFDLYDHDGSQKNKIQECIDGKKLLKYNEKSYTL